MKIISGLKKLKDFLKKEVLINTLMGLLTLVFFLIAGFITVQIILIEYPFNNGVIDVDNDWIGFYGNVVGGFLGVIIALYIFYQKDKKDDKEKIDKLKLFKFHLCHNRLDLIQKDVESLKRRINNILSWKRYNPHENYLFNLQMDVNYEKISELQYNELVEKDFITIMYGLQHYINMFNIELTKFKQGHDKKYSQYPMEKYNKTMQRSYENLIEALNNIEEILKMLDDNI